MESGDVYQVVLAVDVYVIPDIIFHAPSQAEGPTRAFGIGEAGERERLVAASGQDLIHDPYGFEELLVQPLRMFGVPAEELVRCDGALGPGVDEAEFLDAAAEARAVQVVAPRLPGGHAPQ